VKYWEGMGAHRGRPGVEYGGSFLYVGGRGRTPRGFGGMGEARPEGPKRQVSDMASRKHLIILPNFTRVRIMSIMLNIGVVYQNRAEVPEITGMYSGIHRQWLSIVLIVR